MGTFRDRAEAGRLLASQLGHLAGSRPLVLAIPRGGVVVGHQIAKALQADLDLIIARKLGAPAQPELAIGAVVSGGIVLLNEELIRVLGVPRDYIERETQAELAEIERRMQLYRGQRPPPQIEGRTVILTDDGIATGYTMRAAIQATRRQNPKRIVLAIPVAPPSSARMLAGSVDELVCLQTPVNFVAVGQFYDEFHQMSDQEVISLLAASEELPPKDNDQ
jgi:putative phosphoribosyl transferase